MLEFLPLLILSLKKFDLVNFSTNNISSSFKDLLKKNTYNHFDFLAFSSFPFIFNLFFAEYQSKNQFGTYIFVFQILSFFSLIYSVSNLWIINYTYGSKKSSNHSINKLFISVLFLTILAAILCFFILQHPYFFSYFPGFSLSIFYFKNLSISLVGVMCYLSFFPIVYKYCDLRKKFIKSNILIFTMSLMMIFLFRTKSEQMLLMIYNFYYILIFFSTIYFYKKTKSKDLSKQHSAS